MRTPDAQLAAVRADPDDDTPRLAFADWLDENGQGPRGEFVRAQVEQTRLDPGDGRHSALHARELRLLARHATEWTAGPPLLRTARFRRGFAEAVGGPADALAEQLPEVVALAPVRDLRIVGLGEGDGLGARLAALPALAGVDAVMIDDMGAGESVPADQLVALFSSPHLRRVRKLTLFCGACTPEVLDRLLGLPALQHVEELYLNGGLDTDAAIDVLAKHPRLPLRSFRAHKGPHGTWAMSERGLYTLGDSGLWGGLEVLNVGVRPEPGILARLAEGVNFSQLHTLCLHNGAPEGGEGGYFTFTAVAQDYGIEAFAAADAWGHLRDLRFEYMEMHRGQLTALLKARPLRQLTRLSIFGGMLGPEHGAELLRCRALSGLRTLELSANFLLGPGLAEHLAGATHLANLTDLKLIWVQGTDAVAEAVARSPQFSGLRNLELANNYISAKGVQALAESPRLAKVNRLRLFEHPFGPWQRLRLLDGTDRATFRMTRDAAAALARMPNLGCAEVYGYDFPEDSFAPLLSAGELWTPADPRRIADIGLRDKYARRTAELWAPPLDAYLEEEEPYP